MRCTWITSTAFRAVGNKWPFSHKLSFNITSEISLRLSHNYLRFVFWFGVHHNRASGNQKVLSNIRGRHCIIIITVTASLQLNEMYVSYKAAILCEINCESSASVHLSSSMAGWVLSLRMIFYPRSKLHETSTPLPLASSRHATGSCSLALCDMQVIPVMELHTWLGANQGKNNCTQNVKF